MEKNAADRPDDSHSVAASLSRANFKAKLIFGGLLVLVALVLVGVGTFFATRTLRTVPRTTTQVEQNQARIAAIEADRRARILERCEADHKNYTAQVGIIDLLDDLIHQTDITDPRIPPSLQELAIESRLKAEAALAESRALIAQTDCNPAQVR